MWWVVVWSGVRWSDNRRRAGVTNEQVGLQPLSLHKTAFLGPSGHHWRQKLQNGYFVNFLLQKDFKHNENSKACYHEPCISSHSIKTCRREMGFRVDIYHWPPVCSSRGTKKRVSARIQLLAFSEARDRWDPVRAFTISLLFALQNGSKNRNRVNSQCLPLVNTLR